MVVIKVYWTPSSPTGPNQTHPNVCNSSIIHVQPHAIHICQHSNSNWKSIFELTLFCVGGAFLVSCTATLHVSFSFHTHRFGDNVKILHFIGQLKPWVINFDPVSKKANAPQEYKHLADYLDLWWSIFCGEVHPKLVSDMVSCMNCFAWICFCVPDRDVKPSLLLSVLTNIQKPNYFILLNFCAPSYYYFTTSFVVFSLSYLNYPKFTYK